MSKYPNKNTLLGYIFLLNKFYKINQQPYFKESLLQILTYLHPTHARNVRLYLPRPILHLSRIFEHANWLTTCFSSFPLTTLDHLHIEGVPPPNHYILHNPFSSSLCSYPNLLRAATLLPLPLSSLDLAFRQYFEMTFDQFERVPYFNMGLPI
jgi:hypothetical protein